MVLMSVDGSKSGVVEGWEMAQVKPWERVGIGGLGEVDGRCGCGNGHGAPLVSRGAGASR